MLTGWAWMSSATTLLGVADPVRVYEDFASLDLISRGRAEIIAGRSAFVEPFALPCPGRCSSRCLSGSGSAAHPIAPSAPDA